MPRTDTRQLPNMDHRAILAWSSGIRGIRHDLVRSGTRCYWKQVPRLAYRLALNNSSTIMAIQSLQVTPLHPTFGAEVAGVDFTQPISPELYAEIRKVVDKVCP